MRTPPRGYAYGHNADALKRLQLLATVFRPTSDALLRSLSAHQPSVILDLGCGPGDTTRLLHEHFPTAATIVGLDASDEFLAAARARHTRALRFQAADVSSVPLPGAPADLIYARLLLAHLPDATRLAGDWSTQLRSGGVLVLEEVEDIRTEDALLETYLEIPTAALRSRGTDLYVGRALAHLHPPPGITVEHSETAALRPRVADVARMFRLNLETLRHDKAIQSRYHDSDLDDIAAKLALRFGDDARGAITWEMRQLVLKRTG